MTMAALLDALALPAACRVDQRIPKKLLVENAAPTAADKRLLNDLVDEVLWIAALKPNKVGVPDYRDDQREYVEVAILTVTTRRAYGVATDAEATTEVSRPCNTTRLAELLHRSVPYPVLLLLATPQGLSMSGAHKRHAHNEADKVVLDGDVITVDVAGDLPRSHPFMQGIAMQCQPRINLMAMYQGWLDCLTALQAAGYTGSFRLMDNPLQLAARRTALRDYQRLEQDAARLRRQAEKEKQMSRQVALNMALKRIQSEMTTAREQL